MKKPNDQEVVEDIVEEKDDEGKDTTDWKALALKNQGIAKRYQTKLNKLDEEAKAKAKKVKKLKPKDKKEGFDYAEKAFLKVNDVSPDEFPLVRKIMDSTGKTLDEVLESKYFRAEQKELREAKASADAVPAGTKRSGQAMKDKVEYWLAKGEMPPADQLKLRREYVNAKAKAETDGSKFTEHPVIK